MQKFIKDVASEKYAEEGWAKTAYGTSKVGMSMLTRILARDNQAESVLINACDPGWVRTDMAGPRASLTPDQGAITPVYLATLPNDDTRSGKFFALKKEVGWI